MFNSWGLVNAYGTFASYYEDQLLPGHDMLLLNLVGSTQSFFVLALSFIVGRLLDAGYSRYLIGVGWVLVTIGMFMLSLCNGDGQFGHGNYSLIWLTQGFVTGLGMACFFVSSSQIVATWFISRKGAAIGIVASGASISGLVYPMMVKFLIGKVGFNKAVQYVSAVVCFTSFLSFWLATPNPAHTFRKPERWLDLRVWIDKHAFQNAAFCWFMAAIAFMFFGFYAIFFEIEEWAASKGIGYKGDGTHPEQRPKNAIRTFYLLSIMNGCSTVGRISSAYLSDHFGALNVHMVASLLASLLVLLLWPFASTVAAAIAFVILFGAVSGAVIGLPPASVAFILGHNHVQQAKLGQWTELPDRTVVEWDLSVLMLCMYGNSEAVF
ncbi:hypothetical protein W97_04311 [Coniosporium apollinis CBS 100218]|uniref:Major facilitator superfamily (MFS) profile domain-containing protein n=1 Tax=Coniosporium apollinis (strain CBS 100218) TaxID=1168221 RepID=R7YTT5_CONA1|nr:uncharacterized protein W97_04311 [Coniosporium apollinis CBS 100218]EON65076.1 hypothetical protein W97_04311 [Coniosporium apollinis CBS 100218]